MTCAERIKQTKTYVDELLTWVSGRGKILIVVHDNPDPDCLASAYALRHLFTMTINRQATIAFSGMIGRGENLAMAKELEIPVSPLELLNLHDYSVVCMLDTQPGTGNNSLPPGIRVDIIVDHHPRRPTSDTAKWVDIREEYGVTATILYEYLVSQGITINSNLATALFYAIKSETQDLGREANLPDREAYLKLFSLSNKHIIFLITHPKLPVEYFMMINNALRHTFIFDTVLVSNLHEISFPEVVAEMADFLIRLDGIDTSFCMGHYAGSMILSIRTTRCDLGLGTMIRRVIADLGTGGGHGMTAGGKISDIPDDEEAIGELAELLTHRLLAELGKAGVNPHPLLPPVAPGKPH
jgi:nanoRNase/pAp phosphatase (c-di-AMP/oligoRNAs hydrolase)